MNARIVYPQSHYGYLAKVMVGFWVAVFNKRPDQMGCGGIDGAHGDKCYQYADAWAAAGINFYHGALVYLLTYTAELGDTPKHQSCQWVIDNYPHYAPILKMLDETHFLRSNPNNCDTCKHRTHGPEDQPPEQWCYMFADEPDDRCMIHTALTESPRTINDLLNNLIAVWR